MTHGSCAEAAAVLVVMLCGCNGEPPRAPAGALEVSPPAIVAASHATQEGSSSVTEPGDGGVEAAVVAAQMPRTTWPPSCEGEHLDGWTAGNRCLCSDQGMGIGVSIPTVDCPASPPVPSALAVGLSSVGVVRSGQDLQLQVVVSNHGTAPVAFRVARTGTAALTAKDLGLQATDPHGKNIPDDAGTCDFGGLHGSSEPVTSSAGVTLPPGADVTWRVTWRARVHVKSGGVATRLAHPDRWGDTTVSPCHESDVPLPPGVYTLTALAPVLPASFAAQLGSASASVIVSQ